MNEQHFFHSNIMEVDSKLSIDEETSHLNDLFDVCSNLNTTMLPFTSGITQISPYGTNMEVVRSKVLLRFTIIS
jgi:hypothetical protein